MVKLKIDFSSSLSQRDWGRQMLLKWEISHSVFLGCNFLLSEPVVGAWRLMRTAGLEISQYFSVRSVLGSQVWSNSCINISERTGWRCLARGGWRGPPLSPPHDLSVSLPLDMATVSSLLSSYSTAWPSPPPRWRRTGGTWPPTSTSLGDTPRYNTNLNTLWTPKNKALRRCFWSAIWLPFLTG